MIIYLTHNGTRITKEGINLIAHIGDTGKQTIFADKVEQLVIMCKAEITSSARNLLFAKNIDTAFLTSTGRYTGRYCARFSKNIFLRKKQILLSENSLFIKNMAKTIVAGKVTNQLVFMQRLNRKKKVRPFKKELNEVKQVLKTIVKTDDVDAVRGYEGRVSALFFRAYSKNFPPQFQFASRVRRPPTDPTNAVLSLLYTLLMNRVYSAVQISGLDPFVGSLHTLEYGRYSLVLDLMEEFRTIVVDTLTLSLFNLKILQIDDFTKEKRLEPDDLCPAEDSPDVREDHIGNISGKNESRFEDMPEQKMNDTGTGIVKNISKYPVKLTPDGLKKVLSQFEVKLETQFYYPPLERKIDYKRAIIEQAKQYAKVIGGQIKQYTPLTLR